MCSIYQRPDRIELRYCIVCIDPLRLIVKVQESIQVSHLNLPPSSPNHSTKPFAFLNDSGRDSLPPPPVDATLCPPPSPPRPCPPPKTIPPPPPPSSLCNSEVHVVISPASLVHGPCHVKCVKTVKLVTTFSPLSPLSYRSLVTRASAHYNTVIPLQVAHIPRAAHPCTPYQHNTDALGRGSGSVNNASDTRKECRVYIKFFLRAA